MVWPGSGVGLHPPTPYGPESHGNGRQTRRLAGTKNQHHTTATKSTQAHPAQCADQKTARPEPKHQRETQPATTIATPSTRSPQKTNAAPKHKNGQQTGRPKTRATATIGQPTRLRNEKSSPGDYQQSAARQAPHPATARKYQWAEKAHLPGARAKAINCPDMGRRSPRKTQPDPKPSSNKDLSHSNTQDSCKQA